MPYVAGSLLNSGTQSLSSSWSGSLNSGAGADKAVVALILLRDGGGATISGVTYNGVALTSAGTWAVNGSLKAAGYVLPSAASGSNTLAVTFSGTVSQYVVYGAAFTGIDTTSPVDQVLAFTGTSAAPSGDVTPTENNETVIAAIIHEYSQSLTVGSWGTATTTSLADDDRGAWVTSVAYQEQGTAETASVSWSAGGSDTYAAFALTLKEAAVSNDPPTIVANSPADSATVTTAYPAHTMTGSDSNDDDLTYEIRIGTETTFSFGPGDTLVETFNSGSGLKIHPNPSASPDQIDDRPGQSFLGKGGILKKIELYIGDDTYTPSGTMRLRVYAHAGTYGTSSAPANAAAPASTPTTGWLAVSDDLDETAIVTETGAWVAFNFSGANQIRLEQGTPYVFILDWIPDTYVYDNTFAVHGDSNNSGTLHGGNLYIDGASVANNGVQATWDLWFRLTEEHQLIESASDTDPGWSGTPDGTDPFAAGQAVTYTVQSGDEAVDGWTYYWQARASDPGGSTEWSSWTAVRSYDVVIGSSLAPDFIESAASVNEPTLLPGPVTVSPDFLLSTALVFTPNLLIGSTIYPAHIAPTSVVFEPTLIETLQTLSPSFVASTAQVFEPNLVNQTQIVLPGFIASSAVVYSPILLTAQEQTILLSLIASTLTVHEPALFYPRTDVSSTRVPVRGRIVKLRRGRAPLYLTVGSYDLGD